MKFLERITIDANICHGKPCIRGMRWPVAVLLDMLGSGMTYEEILEDHPELQVEDIHAVINYPTYKVNIKYLYNGHTRTNSNNRRVL